MDTNKEKGLEEYYYRLGATAAYKNIDSPHQDRMFMQDYEYYVGKAHNMLRNWTKGNNETKEEKTP